MGRAIDEIGNTYGYLTVIKRAENKDGRANWLCRCKCGKEVEVLGKSLRTGHTSSCGCYNKEKTIERNMERGGGDLTGQRFGKLTVIGFNSWKDNNNGHRDRMWDCVCDCGNKCVVNHRYLRCGDTKSCGCISSLDNAIIKNWLQNNNFNFKSEYSFFDLVNEYNNTPYRFDFALFDSNNNLKCVIEYQGNIHFEVGSGWNTQEKLEDCQRRDKIKFNYCKNKKNMLYYITYKDNIEEKLKEIIDEQF